MKTHELKSHPVNFAPLFDGRKKCEIRYFPDRKFEVGDELLVREWIPAYPDGSGGVYTGRSVRRRITYADYWRQELYMVALSLEAIE